MVTEMFEIVEQGFQIQQSAVAQPPITYTYNSQLHYFKERFDKYERCNIMIHICIVRTTY